MKMAFKRTIALMLSVALLVSCWAFAMPMSKAQAAGNYDVRVTINVTGTNNIEAAYQGFESAKGDSAGVTVRCLKDNGVSSTTTDLNWDIGKKGGNQIKTSGNHTLTGTAAGFPAYIYLYICDNWALSGVGFSVTKLEVKGTSQSSYTTLWSGTIHVASKTNGYGGWLRYDGYVKGFDHGLKNADEGSSGDKNNYINTADKKSWTANFPYRSSGGAVTASNITLDGTNSQTSAFTVADAKDQYSVNYATSNLNSTAMSTPSYNSSYITYSGDSGSPARTITATKNAHISNSGVNSQNVSVTAYWSTRNTTHTMANTTTSKTISITDEKYTYTWNWKETNTSNLDSPSDKSTTDNPYYGDTPSIPTTATATPAYYTTAKHWSGGSYTSPASATANKSYTMTYSTNGASHSYTYSEISGNNDKHKGTCSCGYSPAANFDHDYDTTQFAFADDGKTVTVSRQCKTTGCKHTQSQTFTYGNGITRTQKVAPTCTEKGTNTYSVTSPFGDGAVGTKDVVDINALDHSWGEYSEVLAPTCTEKGSEQRTCSRCESTEARDIPANGHEKYECTFDPGNGIDSTGAIYFACHNCKNYWSAAYDDSQEKYVSEDEYSNPESAISNSEAVPAPEFNSYYNEALDYFYDERGASLKIAEPFDFSNSNTRQGLRFTSSLHIPDSESIPESEVYGEIVDFGFVYSQTELIGENINNLYIGAPNVYKMSVSTNNAGKGAYDGTNWTGVSSHTDDYGGITLTFNLVLNVKAYNWVHPYCARSFVTYNYNGHTYTVYDSDYSSRSVEYIARAVIEHSYQETEKVVNYCQNKILTPIDEGWIIPPNNN